MQDTQVIHGDCLEAMRGMDAASVDAIVTDPPYGLSFMGKHWDHGVPGVDFWAEALRVAKPGTHLLAFGGTRTYHRLACAIEDAGWEVRDCIAWVYGSGFPKSHNLRGDWHGWGTALKPAFEPIIVARKPLIGTVAENVLSHGTGALNIDGCRVAHGGDRLNGGRVSTKTEGWDRPWKHDDGAIAAARARGAEAVARAEALGRWPANLIHDGSAEVVGLFPNAGEQSAARFFYAAKASRRDREEGCECLPVRQTTGGGGMNDPNGDDVCGKYGSVKSPSRNHHPTVKPTALMRYLCRLVTPPGGIVLDPFAGSGSTGKGAVLEGFNFIGIELEAEYVNIARARIEHARTELQRTA